MERDSDIVWKQRLEALEFLNEMRKRIKESRGVYQGDLVNEAREERDSQSDR